MTNLKDKPFALIGVNVAGHDARALRRVMSKEKMTWRSFADRGDIAVRWNLSATPTLYVIDARGMIRHKWVGSPGEKAIDTALERLIKEAPGISQNPPGQTR